MCRAPILSVLGDADDFEGAVICILEIAEMSADRILVARTINIASSRMVGSSFAARP